MWDDIFDIRPTNKEMAALILGVFVFLVAAFSLGYMLGVERTRENVHDNGNGINHVGEQLGQAVSNQQQITDGIKDAEHTSSGIEKTSTAIAESAGHIEAGVGEAAGLIDSSQQILGRIRNRGQANPPAN
jgi:hypothetical protein